MRLLNYLDRKYTLYDQSTFIVSLMFFGCPLGFSFSQGISILIIGWEKYHFNISSFIFTFIFYLIFISPVIINYIRHIRRYNKIVKKFREKSITLCKVKAKFDFSSFKKGISYDFFEDYFFLNFDKKTFLFIHNEKGHSFPMKNIINKFELDDIREERMRKLKKIKKFW